MSFIVEAHFKKEFPKRFIDFCNYTMIYDIILLAKTNAMISGYNMQEF